MYKISLDVIGLCLRWHPQLHSKSNMHGSDK